MMARWHGGTTGPVLRATRRAQRGLAAAARQDREAEGQRPGRVQRPAGRLAIAIGDIMHALGGSALLRGSMMGSQVVVALER